MSSTLQEIGSTVAKLRSLLSEAKKDLARIQSLQDVLTSSLDVFWDDTHIVFCDQQSWKQTLALVASGKTLSVAAQAEDLLRAANGRTRRQSWISNGSEYCTWLAGGVRRLCIIAETLGDQQQAFERAAQLCGRGLSLGYNDVIVKVLLDELIVQEKIEVLHFKTFIRLLTTYEQRQFLLSTLRVIGSKYLATVSEVEDSNSISACSTLLHCLLDENTTIADELCVYLYTTPCSIALARVAIAALNIQYVEKLLHRVWENFGDKLHIRHDSVLQQESTARLLLLCAGYVHRAQPMDLFMHARSSIHSNAMSNRLASSSPRVRLLAMFVGEAISQVVDKDKKTKMIFKLEGAEGQESDLWRKLIFTVDNPRPVSLLKATTQSDLMAVVTATKAIPIRKAKEAKPTKSKIVEVMSESDEEDDLIPFAKPDSDPEDSDEDATLVQRNKPKAPVYIRDLITGLLDSSNPGIHTLALQSAATLIRRKANFGTELLDQLPTLASALTGLQDHFDLEDFQDLRQAAMIATIVAAPKTMGPWYARECFVGDYNIGQRAGVLIAMGLAARDLGGFERIGRNEMNKTDQFPTRMLPSERLHEVYGGSRNYESSNYGGQELSTLQAVEVDALTRAMEQSMLVPVSTKKSRSTQSRTRIIKNDLAAVMAECFFFPLTGYWLAHTRASTYSPYSNANLLSLFLKTLAILLTSAGPSVLVLSQLTSEFWSLLLGQRSKALNDVSILEAVLFAFLSILTVNEGDRRRMATENARELVETQEWVGLVWDRLDGAGAGMHHGKGLAGLTTGSAAAGGETENEQDRCKVLAAGVLVQIKEIMDQYQRLMVGYILRA